MKVGVPIGDLMAGMFASVGILAAVRHQIQTGEGQFIDIGMLDTHVAWLANQALNKKFNNSPDVTGAKGFRILGSIHQS